MLESVLIVRLKHTLQCFIMFFKFLYRYDNLELFNYLLKDCLMKGLENVTLSNLLNYLNIQPLSTPPCLETLHSSIIRLKCQNFKLVLKNMLKFQGFKPYNLFTTHALKSNFTYLKALNFLTFSTSQLYGLSHMYVLSQHKHSGNIPRKYCNNVTTD